MISNKFLIGVIIVMFAGMDFVAGYNVGSSAKVSNHAIDTVEFAVPGAKCQAAGKDAARCEMPDGSKVYCAATAQGFPCTSLSGAKQAPTPQTAAQPPAPPPAPAPAAGSGSGAAAPR